VSDTAKNTFPLVSIITPCLNQCAFIEETIESALKQDYPNIEYIIIDGGSTDGSREVIEKYGDRLAYWISENDDGQADAIRKGFSHSRGEILCWLNSDDIYVSSEVVSRVVKLMSENPESCVVTGGGVTIDAKGAEIHKISLNPDRIHHPGIRYRCGFLQPASFFRRRVIDAVNLDTTLHYAFDWDFWIRVTERFEVVIIDEEWAGYRWWGANKSALLSSMRAAEQREVSRRYLGRISWQYIVSTLCFMGYLGAEKFSGPRETILKSWVHWFSKLITFLSGRRIATM
jgi:glycosyltransferase involved in cell wall biosynthesis